MIKVADIKPIHGRVLVKPDTPRAVTEVGIVIPEIARKRPQQGTVIAVGTAVRELKPKDKVKYFTLAGDQAEITTDIGKCYFMSELEIIGTVE